MGVGSTLDSYKGDIVKGVESHCMNNLEFIATYIFGNPGARRKEIIRELMIYKWGSVPGDIKVRGWGSVYFTDYRCWSGRYGGKLWRRVSENRQSGYLLLGEGLRYVVDRSL